MLKKTKKQQDTRICVLSDHRSARRWFLGRCSRRKLIKNSAARVCERRRPSSFPKFQIKLTTNFELNVFLKN